MENRGSPLLLPGAAGCDRRVARCRRAPSSTSRSSPSPTTTRWTASIVAPPEKTACAGRGPGPRASRAVSSTRSRRAALLPGGQVRAPPVRIGSRAVSRPSIASGGRILMRAAASSIASGRPSSRVQISAIAGALSDRPPEGRTSGLGTLDGEGTLSYCEVAATSLACRRSGRANGRTGYSCSPVICSRTRLVARTLMPGAVTSNSPMKVAASMTCSRLSGTSSVRRSRRYAVTCVAIASSPVSRSPSAWAIAPGTSAGSVIASSVTRKTPCSNRSTWSAAAWSESRVLRCAGTGQRHQAHIVGLSSDDSASASSSRPMN